MACATYYSISTFKRIIIYLEFDLEISTLCKVAINTLVDFLNIVTKGIYLALFFI